MRTGSWKPALMVLALLCGGCGGDDGDAGGAGGPGSPTATTSTPTAAPSATVPDLPDLPDADCARLLPRRDAERLAGVALEPAKPQEISALPGCSWESSKTGAVVQVINVPASVWARVVPAVVGQALSTGEDFDGREELEQALGLLEAGGASEDGAACGVFATIANALQGEPARTTRVLNYLPAPEQAQAVALQACLEGRYYSVQLVADGLVPGAPLEKRIATTLRTLRG